MAIEPDTTGEGEAVRLIGPELIETAIMHQSTSSDRSPFAPTIVVMGVATLSYQTEQEVCSPDDPTWLLMLIEVSPLGTVNVLRRCVPKPIAQAEGVSVVTAVFMSSLSLTGPILVATFSTAPLPLAPPVFTPERRKATAEAGLLLPVRVMVIAPADGLAPSARNRLIPHWFWTLSTLATDTQVRPLPATEGAIVSSRSATATSSSSLAAGVQEENVIDVPETVEAVRVWTTAIAIKSPL